MMIRLAFILAALLFAGPSFAQPVRIVAAENFYGDIAAQIGGADIAVTSILSNPGQDPHLFEASPSVARAVAGADIVILNGAGYDPWMEKLLAATPNKQRKVISLAELTGRKDGDNPHLWYDLAAPRALATALAAALATAAPAKADSFKAKAESFSQSLTPLAASTAAIAQAQKGLHVAATEPVFGYMLEAMGLEVEEKPFQLAVMNDTEPAVSDVARFESDLKSKTVKLFIHNTQASSPLVDKLAKLAAANGIAVVGVTETMPPGQSYQAWLAAEIAATAKALEAAP